MIATLISRMTATTSCCVCPPTMAREMRGTELGAEHRAADEADEAQRANDKALPVAGDRERDGNDEEGEIKQITAHGVHGIRYRLELGPSLIGSLAPMTHLGYRYAAPCGSSLTTVASQGRSHPPRASSRSVISAVKPQISIESMRNAGPLARRGTGA